MDQRQHRQERAKRWEQQRREQQRQQQREWEREQQQRQKELREEQERQRPKTMNDLPAEMIHEIFDRNPEAGLVLARTNKWFSEVLKDKIKKYRELIRECNSASVCYGKSFGKINQKECEEAWNNKSRVTTSFACYFNCLSCFRSFENDFFFGLYLLVRSLDQIQETGIALCDKCALKYHGKRIKQINAMIEAMDRKNDDSGSVDFEDYHYE